MNNSLYLDLSYSQITKTGENICGDVFITRRYPEERRVIAVLSDGLGSGVKANILAQMTATMLIRYVEQGRDIRKAAEVMMETLPVCQVRKISYSTFTIVDCYENGTATVIEEGNPEHLLFRNGQLLESVPEIIQSKKFRERQIKRYELKLMPEDRLIFLSDGITQAGLGSQSSRSGWTREGVARFLRDSFEKVPSPGSMALASELTRTSSLFGDEPVVKDDISAAVLHVRHPAKLTLFTGPPFHKERDREHVLRFINTPGKRVVCGGTTSGIIARELGFSVETKMGEGGLPGVSSMTGVDLVTEGILTLTRLMEYLLTPPERRRSDAAVSLYNMIMESDCISFLVGSSLNKAYHDPDWPVELELRKNLIKRISKVLEDRYLKKVEVEFI